MHPHRTKKDDPFGWELRSHKNNEKQRISLISLRRSSLEESSKKTLLQGQTRWLYSIAIERHSFQLDSLESRGKDCGSLSHSKPVVLFFALLASCCFFCCGPRIVCSCALPVFHGSLEMVLVVGSTRCAEQLPHPFWVLFSMVFSVRGKCKKQ